MATEEKKAMRYPAAIEGYFDDESSAQTAADELDALELGDLPRDFVKVSVIKRTVRAAELAEAPPGLLDRIMAAIKPDKPAPEEVVRNDVAVIARGTPDHITEARKVLERHGARDIKEYSTD